MRSAGSPWFTPTLETRAVSLKLSFKKAYSSADLHAKENSICGTYTSHLLLKIIVSYIAVEAINCFHVFQSQFKVKHLKRRKNHINLFPKELASPWGLKDFPAGWGQQEGIGKPCLSSVRQKMSLVKDIPQEPSAHSPTHHLYVLFDALLVVTLGQNHNPTLYLVAKGNQSWSLLVLFGNGRENWVLQEKGEVWVHPGRKFRNAEELRLSTQFMKRLPKHIRYVSS